MTEMTDARALDFIRVYLAPYAAHGEKDLVVQHIAARLCSTAPQPPAEAQAQGDAGCGSCSDGCVARGTCRVRDESPPTAPDRIVLWSRGVVPNWYFIAKKAGRPDIEGAPVYETLDEIILRGSPEAQQPAACTHSWHDYGTVNRAWCSRCNAVAVIGHEDRPYGVLSVTDDGEYRADPIQQPAAVDEAKPEWCPTCGIGRPIGSGEWEKGVRS